ncbi:hypothetical protein PPYR_02208 [Photinus pyralis]|uniref:Cytosine-specific methyltransferase n=1 Tax=Photinus pyralis TaxID=7054 RepID=A0A1Y1N290_PHOPY|nr:DNA (cytosine-5)-methyltransferase PliMCI-like [Photinus pyralis]KAB0805238.1 hypothetical protein PPYR_02208 [Photinus pyralis]
MSDRKRKIEDTVPCIPIEEQTIKKLKILDNHNGTTENTIKTQPFKTERCNICRQYLNEVAIYNGHPNYSVEEFISLTDPKLMLFTGEESDINERDVHPVHKITYFSVYDKNGHLCPFDTGLIEANKPLYFSGYIKPIYEDDPTTNNGIPTHDMGPINEWFLSGFDGGEKALVGFSTLFAEYYLMEASPEYEPMMKILRIKIHLAKIVIEFLIEEACQEPTYEDLLQYLLQSNDPDQTEDTLLRHAQFICDQVSSFDEAADSDEQMFITTPCMRTLVEMAGVTFRVRKRMRKIENKTGIKKKPSAWSKATTTKLVQEVFETFFPDQIDRKENDDKGPRRKRCGICEACQRPDCGKCAHCQNMLKFGGTGRSKQACLVRRCPNMAIQAANEDASDGEDDQADSVNVESKASLSKRIIHKVMWIDEATFKHKARSYYQSAQVGDLVIELDDCVVLNSEEPNQPLWIARVGYMWQERDATLFHAHLFCRGSDTVLGETADPRELFVVDVCENCPLGSIVRKANVEKRTVPKNWATNGGLDSLPPRLDDDGRTFFYSKRYDSENSRFVDLQKEEEDESIPYTPCDCCRRRNQKKKHELITYQNGAVHWCGDIYRVGSGVFLEPDAFSFKSNATHDTTNSSNQNENHVNHELYPEYYRKRSDNLKGSNAETPDPFCIALIEDIVEFSNAVKIRVRKFYRPENTHEGSLLSYRKDLNLVYWSTEEKTVNFSLVTGKCYIACSNALEIPVDEWSSRGPYRFYFTQAYDEKKQLFYDVPSEGLNIGLISKGKGKGKGKSKQVDKPSKDLAPEWDVPRKLKCMDVFAGCGGLSEGLHQAKIAETKWAIEKEPAAARAFKLNNPDAIVYTEDCNELLRMIMSEKESKRKGLPRKGEVELLVGGPPCQGFSGMNRFNAGQYSLFKNSLISSYLSFCDYYRPAYFILENVRNFVSFKRSMVLKLTLRCLLAIGYQVTFGVVQAGHYGVPQTRRRLIIMAAAPGMVLPAYPEPQHVFSKKGCQLSVPVDDFKFYTGVKWGASAPYRTITVRDAMSDLPKIRNGSNSQKMPYDSEPISHFQRVIRDHNATDCVIDHICKEMAPIVESRMSHIPIYPGADWRDLPNSVLRLSDGTFTNKLKYPYRFKKQKSSEPCRGVCACAVTGHCDAADRQSNTLIPWCLPHTADRHNNWSGLYGRLGWDGFFSTTVTNPEPMGKQGRVLHPEQHRVVSVRECARSQGFPDKYQFHGNILDKHRQVGNAVPPPLGAAIGKEIAKALTLTLKPVN